MPVHLALTTVDLVLVDLDPDVDDVLEPVLLALFEFVVFGLHHELMLLLLLVDVLLHLLHDL